MKVSEIFSSLQGEGLRTGVPMAFLRLYGCGTGCAYCDTGYAINGSYEELTYDQIITRLKSYNTDWVEVTGGEPLMHEYLSHLLQMIRGELRRKIEIWTSGVHIPPWWFSELCDGWVVDVKCPSAHAKLASKIGEWWPRMRPEDQLKFTVATEEDLEFVLSCLKMDLHQGTIIISPVIPTKEEVWEGRPWLQRVANFCLEHNLRMSLQQHKILYGNVRGR